MFENVGEKIKSFARNSFAVAVIIYIIGAMALWIISIDEGNFFVWAGFILLIFGPASAWVTSLLLYGFGELVVNSKEKSGFATEENETICEEELPEL